ncbi:hypothetical protein HDU97_009791 [Phlyctochytrium planicorne]|nr:hypothetical protein HDU97_009791 [Phlyctochytrium planicorne]
MATQDDHWGKQAESYDPHLRHMMSFHCSGALVFADLLPEQYPITLLDIGAGTEPLTLEAIRLGIPKVNPTDLLGSFNSGSGFGVEECWEAFEEVWKGCCDELGCWKGLMELNKYLVEKGGIPPPPIMDTGKNKTLGGMIDAMDFARKPLHVTTVSLQAAAAAAAATSPAAEPQPETFTYTSQIFVTLQGFRSHQAYQENVLKSLETTLRKKTGAVEKLRGEVGYANKVNEGLEAEVRKLEKRLKEVERAVEDKERVRVEKEGEVTRLINELKEKVNLDTLLKEIDDYRNSLEQDDGIEVMSTSVEPGSEAYDEEAEDVEPITPRSLKSSIVANEVDRCIREDEEDEEEHRDSAVADITKSPPIKKEEEVKKNAVVDPMVRVDLSAFDVKKKRANFGGACKRLIVSFWRKIFV